MMYLNIVCTTLVILKSAAARYEWNDYYYNQEIIDQLDDHFHPWLFDRDGDKIRKLPRFRSHNCCGHYDEATLKREDSVREQCYKNLFDNWRFKDYAEGWNPFIFESTVEVRNRMKCVHQCLWRLRGTLDNTNNKRDHAIREYYLRGNGNEKWREEIAQQAVSVCLPVYDPTVYPPPRRGECSAAHLSFSYCVWREFHKNCPDNHWNSESEYCRRVRRYIRKG